MAIIGVDVLMKKFGGHDHIYGGDTNSTITILGGSVSAEKFYEDFKSYTLKYVNEILSYADENKGLEHSLIECIESAGLGDILNDKVGYLKRCMYLHYIQRDGGYDYTSRYVNESAIAVASSVVKSNGGSYTSEEKKEIFEIARSLYTEIFDRLDGDISWTIPLQQIDSVIYEHFNNYDMRPLIICRNGDNEEAYSIVDAELIRANGDADDAIQLHVWKLISCFLFILSWINKSRLRRLQSIRDNIGVVKETILAGGIGIYMDENSFDDNFTDDLHRLIYKMLEKSNDEIVEVLKSFNEDFDKADEEYSLIGCLPGRSKTYRVVNATLNVVISPSGDVAPFVEEDAIASTFRFKDRFDTCFNLLSALIPDGDYGYTIDIHPKGCSQYVLENVVFSSVVGETTKFSGAGGRTESDFDIVPDNIKEDGMMLVSFSKHYVNG